MKKYLKKNKYIYYYKYPLKNITTIKNNGNTKYLVYVKSIEELIDLINYLNKKKRKYLIIGNGSKLVFVNNYKGVLISLKKLNKIEVNDCVEVDAGVNLLSLINSIKKHNLGGIEALSGIPSTIGAALANNATSHNVTLFDYLDKVLVYKNKLMYLNKNDINYSYRYSSLKNYIVLKAYFKFDNIDEKYINENIKKYLNYRKNNQVMTYPNIGSIFKNKNNIKVIDIIKKCKLENIRYKNISLSKKHINFININGKVNGKNILKFVNLIQKKVKKSLNINLESEIIFIKS